MKNNMKKIIGVVLGVSLLSVMAYTAFAADLSPSTLTGTSITSPTTSSVDVKTNDTSVSTVPTTNTTSTVTTNTTTVNTTTATPTTNISPALANRIVVTISLEGGDTAVGTKNVLIKAYPPVQSVEVFIRPVESSDAHYLGKANFDPVSGKWVYPWNSVNTSDGSYILSIKPTLLASTDALDGANKPLPVIVKNNEKASVTTSSVTEEYLRKIEEENKIKLEEQKNRLSEITKIAAIQNENNQPASGQRVLPGTGITGTISRPSKLTSAEIYKAVNENSQKLKDAIDQGDANKEAAVIAEIVRVAQGTSAQSDPESTRNVEEAVAKLKQVLVDQTRGVVDETTFKVESVKVAEITTKPDGTQTASKIEFRGKALPNSFVTVYIYSIPIVVTVKADSEGNWNYTLDKELDNGNHQVYVGLTDVKGKVVVKSNPLPFIKTASAITVEEALAVPQAEAAPNFVQNNNFYGIVTIIILVLISVFIFLGFKMSKNPTNPTE